MNPEQKNNHIPDNEEVEVEIDNLLIDLSGDGNAKGDMNGTGSGKEETTATSESTGKKESDMSKPGSQGVDSNENKQPPKDTSDDMIDTSDDTPDTSGDGSDTSNTPTTAQNAPSSDTASQTEDKNKNPQEENKDSKEEDKNKNNSENESKGETKDAEGSNDEKKDTSSDDKKKNKDDDSMPSNKNKKNEGLDDKKDNKDNLNKNNNKSNNNNPNKDNSNKNNLLDDNKKGNKEPSKNDSVSKNNSEGANKANNNKKKDTSNSKNNNPSLNNKNQNRRNANPNKNANSNKTNRNPLNKLRNRNNKPNRKAGSGLKKSGEKAEKTAKTVKNVATGLKKIIMWLIAHPVVLGIIVAVIVFIIVILAAMNALGAVTTPGQGADIKSDYSQFSENDKKILEDINNIPGMEKENAELAIYTLLYPYFETLQDGTADPYLTSNSGEDYDKDEYLENNNNQEKRNKILEVLGCDELCQELLGSAGTDQLIKAYSTPSVKCTIKQLFGFDQSGSDTCNTITEQELDKILDQNKQNEDQTVVLNESDDPYVKFMSSPKYKKQLEMLLSKLSSDTKDGEYASETAYFNYLKSNYFNEDAGYKALFFQTNDKEGLEKAIIEQLKRGAKAYEVYIKENPNCAVSYNYQSAGQITLTDVRNEIPLQDVLTKNLVFDVKEPCISSGAKSIASCKSYYDSYISMEQYLIGVTVQESESSNVEELAANMVAEKSDIIQKAYRRGDVAKVDDSTYVVRVKDSVGDQRYCDYMTLAHCSSGKTKLSDEQLSIFKEAFEKSKNDYIWDGKDFLGSVCQTQTQCDCGSHVCFGQTEAYNYAKSGEDYREILLHEYQSVKGANILTVDGNYLSSSIGTATTNCPSDYTNGNGLGIPDDQFIFLFQDHNTTGFCGSGCSIASSGCGGTTYAMLVANLSDQNNFTPNDASRDGTGSNHCGCGGSDDGLFTNVLVNKHSGFTTKTLPRTLEGAQEVIETIRNGGLVAVNVQGPHSEFTTGGHWMLIRGLTEDGKVKVANPNKNTAEVKHPGQNQKGFNVEDFINNNYLIGSDGRKHNWIAIYGPKSEQIKTANQSALDTENADVEGATKNKYFAPIQNLKPTFKSVSSTPGCSNSVSHDISGLSEGTKLYAGMDGTAEFKQTYCGSQLVSYGNRVQITGSDGTYIIYGHLKDFPSSIKPKITKTCPKKGSTPPCPASSCSSTTTTIATVQVKKGDYIGTLGNTGNSTGPHLHVEIHEGGGKSCVVNPWSAFGMR